MYVRDAKKREEVWLLDQLDAFDFEDPAFRSRDYVVVLDEDRGGKVGFGRLRIHKGEQPFCELTCIGVLEDRRRHGVGAHIIERLVELARDQDFTTVYVFTGMVGYLEQFGFEEVEPDSLTDAQRGRLKEVRETMEKGAVPMTVSVRDFGIPSRLRRRWESGDEEPEEKPEDFGIDPDSATYKYDTGRR